MKIHAVLVRPHEAFEALGCDPHGLLKEGPFGARPPMAYQESGTGIWRPYRGPLGEGHPENNDALVLAWGGEPVPEGCFRASEGSRYLSYTSVRNIVDTVLRGKVHGDQPILEERGTLVLLDAEGREMTDG